MKRTHFSNIHFTAKFFFQIDKQSPGEPRRCAWAGLDQQIEVAVLARVAPGKGTKHTHALNAMLSRNGEDRATFAQLINGHALPFSHPRQYWADLQR